MKKCMTKILCLAIGLIAAPASADEIRIFAEEFDSHSYSSEARGIREDSDGENVRELKGGQQLHIRYRIDTKLYNDLAKLEESETPFAVCVELANRDESKTNRVRITHFNPAYSKSHEISSSSQKILCSNEGPFDSEKLRSAGVKVLTEKQRQGPVYVRSVSFRPVNNVPTPNPGRLTTETSPSWDLDLKLKLGTDKNGLPSKKEKPEVNEQAWTVLTVGDVVYVGGDFRNIKKGNRLAKPTQQYIAAFDRNSGERIPGFDIKLNGKVKALAISADNKTLYVGGMFTSAGGKPRKNFAVFRISKNSWELSDFQLKLDGEVVNPNYLVQDVVLWKNKLYLGGYFTKFGRTVDYPYAAAFDLKTGELFKKFKPKPNERVSSLLARWEEGLWIGQEFTVDKKGNKNPKGLLLVDYITGERNERSPDVRYPVIDLAATDKQLFVAGGGRAPPIWKTRIVDGKKEFVRDENGKKVALKDGQGSVLREFTGNIGSAYDRDSLEMQWEIIGDGNVQAVDVRNDQNDRYVYFGGHYRTFRRIRNSETGEDVHIEDGDKVERLSRHNKSTGMIDFSWTPFVDGRRSINDIDVTKSGLYVVGDFKVVGGDAIKKNDPRRNKHRGFAIFNGATR